MLIAVTAWIMAGIVLVILFGPIKMLDIRKGINDQIKKLADSIEFSGFQLQ